MKIDNTILEGFQFNLGWKLSTSITMFGNLFPVVIKLKAYSEKDSITQKQKEVYLSSTAVWSVAERLLLEYDADAATRFTPTMLLIDRDGACALLCDDEQDIDDGVAVCLTPFQQVVSQDEYL